MSLSGYISIHAGEPVEENNATPRHPVGTKAVTPDGRTFRYAKAGAAALAAGQLQVAADLTALHSNLVPQAAAAIGAKTVSITVGAAAIAANEYIDGYLVVDDGAGEAYSYRITRHDTCTAAGGTVTFDIHPRLQVALAVATTTVTLVRNPYSAVVIATGGTQTDIPVGVALRTVTAAYYCWLQTGGVCSLLSSGTNTPTAGQPVTIGEANDGSVSERDAIAEPLVGIAPTGVNATAGEHDPYFLTLEASG